MTVLLSAGSVIAFGQVPAQALGCHGSSCDGRYPAAYGCTTDAVVLATVTFADHAAGGTFGQQVVELRYSAHCNASWARVISTAGGTASVTWGRAWIQGYRLSTTHTRHSAGTAVSNMRAGKSVVACGRSSWNHGAVTHLRCVA
jgi:hypothetical protein